jgi:hypothetical protein
MNETMTLPEIEARFDSEWVLIGDPLTDENLSVRGGTVLWHSKDRDELYRKAVEQRPKRFAVHFTGAIPADTEVIL